MKYATESFKMFYEPLDEAAMDYLKELNRNE